MIMMLKTMMPDKSRVYQHIIAMTLFCIMSTPTDTFVDDTCTYLCMMNVVALTVNQTKYQQILSTVHHFKFTNLS